MGDLSSHERELIFQLAEQIVGSSSSESHRREVLVTNVGRRVQATKSTSLIGYLNFAKQDPNEYKQLVSALTIHTTSWFREQAHFIGLKERILERIEENKKNYKFSLLSAACSSGEEVYSFALVLENIRREVPTFDYSVVGKDIDPICIQHAKRALYHTTQLKGISSEYHKHILKGTGKARGFFTLSPEIRRRCTFSVQNLTHPTAAKSLKSYDQIVCRNVLIYFSANQIKQIVSNLLSQLSDDGYLVLGHSEAIDTKPFNIQFLGNTTYVKQPKNSSVDESSCSKYRVLVVDDSPTVQKLLVKLIGDAGINVEAVGSADEASKYLAKRSVDLITLDLHMPGIDGQRWLSSQRRNGMKTPVVVVSDANPKEAVQVLGALTSGAQDYVNKGQLQSSRRSFIEMLTHIIEAHKSKAAGVTSVAPKRNKKAKLFCPDVILCGASTGGTQALSVLLKNMPADSPPVVVVQHISSQFAAAFAERLAQAANLKCVEPKNGIKLEPGCIYLSHGDFHIGIKSQGGELHLTTSESPPLNRHRPSVDFLFHSASVLTNTKILAVLLTGMGYDGAKGLVELDDQGAMTFVQDEDSSVVFGMPGEALRLGAKSVVASPPEIRQDIDKAVKSVDTFSRGSRS